ncbi:MAG: hypothetical protein ABSA75_10745 [Candidatus Bathyarchaeia archaeon]
MKKLQILIFVLFILLAIFALINIQAHAQVAPVIQPITVTMNNSAPAATVTITDTGTGTPSPSTFPADGSVHNINGMDQGDSFTLLFSNAGNSRDGFIVSNAFSATSSPNPASIVPLDVTAYEQVQNTFSTAFNDGNPGSSDSLVLTGTYLGTSSSNIVALNSGNSWSASAWSDYNAAVTFPASTTLSGSSERWSIGNAFPTAALIAGGSSYPKAYYNQYLQTLSYSVVGGGSPSAPTASGKELGSVYAPSLTASATGYWFDASGSITFSTPTGSNEQWAPSPASILATSANTQVVSIYNQYQVTASYITSDASSPSSAVILTGTALGSGVTPTLTTSAQLVWLDAGSSWSVNNPITSGTQRWYAASGTSGTVSGAVTVQRLLRVLRYLGRSLVPTLTL